MHEILKVAISAAKAGGDVITLGANKLGSLTVEQKSLHDYVSEVDRNSENAIREIILSSFPDHQIIGEEYGVIGKNTGVQWVIDPLDGTTNFLRAIPHYAVSIGVMVDAVLEHAVVYDPAKNELYRASRGQGAFLNNELIRVSNIESARGGLYSTGVPFSGDNLAEVDSFTSTMLGLLSVETSGLRRLGAAALDLAYVAAGRYDGFWEAKLKLWDIAAGALLVQEAGGVVSDLHGRNQYLSSGDIVAASPKVHSELVEISSANYQRP